MKEKIRDIFLNLGADVCGVANIDAYQNNTRGFDVVNCNKCRVVCPKAFGKK